MAGDRRSQVSVALISGVAGLVGVLAGGLLTYATNKSTLEQQLQRENHQQVLVARGDARLYQETLYEANQGLRHALKSSHRWPVNAELSEFALPSLEDRRLVQSQVSSTSYKHILSADGAMLAMASIIHIQPAKALSAQDRTQIEEWQTDLSEAADEIRKISD